MASRPIWTPPRRPLQTTAFLNQKANEREGPFGGPFFTAVISELMDQGQTLQVRIAREHAQPETDGLGGRARIAKRIVDFKEKSVSSHIAVREITSHELQMQPRLGPPLLRAQKRAKIQMRLKIVGITRQAILHPLVGLFGIAGTQESIRKLRIGRGACMRIRRNQPPLQILRFRPPCKIGSEMSQR